MSYKIEIVWFWLISIWVKSSDTALKQELHNIKENDKIHGKKIKVLFFPDLKWHWIANKTPPETGRKGKALYFVTFTGMFPLLFEQENSYFYF